MSTWPIVSSCGLALALLLGGCNGIDVAKWTEEVRLHDGRTIYVERIARARSWGFPNARRGRAIDYELLYKPLAIHWRADGPSNLMSFEIFGGVPYLVVYRDAPAFCDEHGSGQLKAFFYRWSGNEWKQIDQSNFPIDVALTNLYRQYRGHDAASDAKGTISWRHKAMRDGFDPERPDTIHIWYKKYNRICK